MTTASVRSSDGTTIAFERSGEGPPLIVVGGALGDRAAAGPVTALLTPRFTVFAYDRRGRGDSGDTQPYAVEREVEDLSALIDEAGGSVFVYGHSSGAALALTAALQGLSITQLALYEPPFIVDDSRQPVPEDYTERLDELVGAGRRGDALVYFMTVGVGLPIEVVEQMREAPMWPAMESLAHTLAYDGAVMEGRMGGRPLPETWATSVPVPTLVIDGENSPAWQHNAARALAALLPNAEHRTLEGQDHGAAPEVLAPVLEGFFAG